MIHRLETWRLKRRRVTLLQGAAEFTSPRGEWVMSWEFSLWELRVNWGGFALIVIYTQVLVLKCSTVFRVLERRWFDCCRGGEGSRGGRYSRLYWVSTAVFNMNCRFTMLLLRTNTRCHSRITLCISCEESTRVSRLSWVGLCRSQRGCVLRWVLSNL